MKRNMTVKLRILWAIALSFAAMPAFAVDSFFVQGGTGKHVQSVNIGATWDWQWRHDYSVGTLTGYTEVELGRWQTTGRPSNDGFTEVGVTPVFRLYPGGIGNGWFIEAAVGASLISPVYHNDNKLFSTTFQFGDHLGAGVRFGAQQQHEVALRFEHFSNGAIKHPNPGENFVQLRYAHRF
jgi:lipid A 3-O-deacylase